MALTVIMVFATLMTLVVDPVFLLSLGSTLIFILVIAYPFSHPDAYEVTADAGASAAAASSDPPAVEPANQKPEKPIRPQKCADTPLSRIATLACDPDRWAPLRPASSTTRASPLCLHTFKVGLAPNP